MNFWLIAAILTIVVAIICFYPLLKQYKPEHSVARDKLNKAFYFHRLKELERDEQQGLLDNSEQLKRELQQSLLEDIPSEQQINKEYSFKNGKLFFVLGCLLLAIISVSSYLPIGSWQEQEKLAKNYGNLPHFYERMKEGSTKPLNHMELAQFVQALRLKLQAEPNNPKDWAMLGELGMRLNNPRLAVDSYAKAYKLESSNSSYALSYAKMLLLSADPADNSNGEKIAREVLNKERNNLEALSLLGFYFFEKEDYINAKIMWTMLLQQLPEKDPRVFLLKRTLLRVDDAIASEAKLKENPSPEVKETPKIAP